MNSGQEKKDAINVLQCGAVIYIDNETRKSWRLLYSLSWGKYWLRRLSMFNFKYDYFW